MNTIPQAKEFLKQTVGEGVYWENWQRQIPPIVYTAMIEFAKLHLKAQQEAILKNVDFTYNTYAGLQEGSSLEIDKESSAYNINEQVK